MMCSSLIVLSFLSLVLWLSLTVSGHSLPKDSAKRDDENTLRLVFSLFRHGDRTQEDSYPNDPYINMTFFPYGLGELTNGGIQRSFQLGRNLRKKYTNFLGSIYYGGIVDARSSDYDRTKATLSATLAGLFPPHPINIWSEEEELAAMWYSIPFEVTPILNDTIILGGNCPNYKKLYEQYKQTSEYQDTFAKYTDLFAYVLKYAGEKIEDLGLVRYFFYRFKFQEAYDLTIPEWTKPIYPEQLTDAMVDGYYAACATSEMRKYLTGYFFKEIVEEIQKKMDGTLEAGRKMYLYSAHEINIGYLMVTLGIMYNHAPEFCENLTFEAHEIKGEYYVRILHQELVGEEPKAVNIRGCAEYCPFGEFVSYLSDVLPGPNDSCYDRTY